MKKQIPIEQIEAYIITMTHAKTILDKGLISAKEYTNFETKILNKYGLSLDSIYRIIT